MVGFEKALRAVKVIKDQIQYRSQSLLNLARGNFTYNEIIFLLQSSFFQDIQIHSLALWPVVFEDSFQQEA